MSDCELSDVCAPFYEKLTYMQSTARLMRGAYCQWKYEECARYVVCKVNGKDNIPLDLYPSDFAGAKRLIT